MAAGGITALPLPTATARGREAKMLREEQERGKTADLYVLAVSDLGGEGVMMSRFLL